MYSRQLLNIMMLVFAIGLVATALLSRKIEQTLQHLSETDATSVQEISIQHKERTIKLRKIASGWKMTQPVSIQTNEFRIATLLKLLNTTSYGHYDSNALQLEDYGLNNSETRVNFDELEITFGITNPVNNFRYVLFNQQVHLIDDLYYPLLSSQLGTLISHRLLEDDTEISRLQLPEFEFWRDDQQRWQSASDISTDAIVETIENWKQIQAFAVHDYVEREALGTIKIHTPQARTAITFIITDTDPWLIIARPDKGIEYHFNLDAYNSLLQPGQNSAVSSEQENTTIEVQSDDFLNVINR